MFGRIFVDIWVWRFHLGEYYVHWWLSDYSNDLFHVECFVVDSVFRGTGPFHLNCQIYVCRIVCSIPLLFCWCLRVYGEILCFICNTDSLCLLPFFSVQLWQEAVPILLICSRHQLYFIDFYSGFFCFVLFLFLLVVTLSSYFGFVLLFC